jgi:O-antigen biosynthesis protein WbqP
LNTLLISCIDRLFAMLGILVASPLLILILLIGFFDTGSPLFFQRRVGKHQRAFTLMKFRTMRTDTANVATHQVNRDAVTSLGMFLRKTKLDELPQLLNVLKGEMSLVGPRPCLLNQDELIAERQQRGVFAVLPGITGLAQVNDIDMSDPVLLAQWDQRMIEGYGLSSYFKYLLLTLVGKGQGDKVR